MPGPAGRDSSTRQRCCALRDQGSARERGSRQRHPKIPTFQWVSSVSLRSQCTMLVHYCKVSAQPEYGAAGTSGTVDVTILLKLNGSSNGLLIRQYLALTVSIESLRKAQESRVHGRAVALAATRPKASLICLKFDAAPPTSSAAASALASGGNSLKPRLAMAALSRKMLAQASACCPHAIAHGFDQMVFTSASARCAECQPQCCSNLAQALRQLLKRACALA